MNEEERLALRKRIESASSHDLFAMWLKGRDWEADVADAMAFVAKSVPELVGETHYDWLRDAGTNFELHHTLVQRCVLIEARCRDGCADGDEHIRDAMWRYSDCVVLEAVGRMPLAFHDSRRPNVDDQEAGRALWPEEFDEPSPG